MSAAAYHATNSSEKIFEEFNPMNEVEKILARVSLRSMVLISNLASGVESYDKWENLNEDKYGARAWRKKYHLYDVSSFDCNALVTDSFEDDPDDDDTNKKIPVTTTQPLKAVEATEDLY